MTPQPIPTEIPEWAYTAMLDEHPAWRAKMVNGDIIHVDAAGQRMAMRYTDSRNVTRFFRYPKERDV